MKDAAALAHQAGQAILTSLSPSCVAERGRAEEAAEMATRDLVELVGKESAREMISDAMKAIKKEQGHA
jgi:hypothetical protein